MQHTNQHLQRPNYRKIPVMLKTDHRSKFDKFVCLAKVNIFGTFLCRSHKLESVRFLLKRINILLNRTNGKWSISIFWWFQYVILIVKVFPLLLEKIFSLEISTKIFSNAESFRLLLWFKISVSWCFTDFDIPTNWIVTRINRTIDSQILRNPRAIIRNSNIWTIALFLFG